MKSKIIIYLITVSLLFVNVEAYRVFPTTAQDERMFDKSNFPFISQNADGFRVQHDEFKPFTDEQVETIFEFSECSDGCRYGGRETCSAVEGQSPEYHSGDDGRSGYGRFVLHGKFDPQNAGD